MRDIGETLARAVLLSDRRVDEKRWVVQAWRVGCWGGRTGAKAVTRPRTTGN